LELDKTSRLKQCRTWNAGRVKFAFLHLPSKLGTTTTIREYTGWSD
jgi:hypothetical protein